MGRLAIVTQSYRKDMRECELLCESIQRFAPPHIPHYIFVNDEDYDLFRANPRLNGSEIRRKGEVLPWYMFRFPMRILGHHYHLSPFTIPVREWIIQQICKLGVFDVLPDDIDTVMHVDSECVFLRPFDEDSVSRIRPDGGRDWVLYKRIWEDEPSHDEYMSVARRLLPIPADNKIDGYTYMAQPTIMVKENVRDMLRHISASSLSGDWRLKLSNTYRFSEFYLYCLYSEYALNMRNHYLTDTRLLPVMHIARFGDTAGLAHSIREKMSEYPYLGVCLQKGNRNEATSLTHDQIHDTVTSLF
ncbi:MAG: hypothetical protein HDS01_03690 [Bacteroides sp.]|nr:hypothetical protein [Bacteroides sp.]